MTMEWRAIDALDKDNERLMVINQQFKAKYENQRGYLAAYKRTPSFASGGQKKESIRI